MGPSEAAANQETDRAEGAEAAGDGRWALEQPRWTSPRVQGPAAEQAQLDTCPSPTPTASPGRGRKRSAGGGSKNVTREEDGGAEEGEGGDGEEERGCPGLEPKRPRFTREQLQYLRKEFSEDTTLGKERKGRLATELHMEARQVAIWFQNNRAQHKTELLKQDHANLKLEKEALAATCKGLKQETERLRHHSRNLVNWWKKNSHGLVMANGELHREVMHLSAQLATALDAAAGGTARDSMGHPPSQESGPSESPLAVPDDLGPYANPSPAPPLAELGEVPHHEDSEQGHLDFGTSGSSPPQVLLSEDTLHVFDMPLEEGHGRRWWKSEL